jgi:hypothetical protein
MDKASSPDNPNSPRYLSRRCATSVTTEAPIEKLAVTIYRDCVVATTSISVVSRWEHER